MKRNLWLKHGTKAMSGAMAAVMLSASVLSMPSYAASNGANVEEKLYINLDEYGKKEKVNVVKNVTFTTGSTYTDYGNYLAIQNMSDHQEPSINGDAVTWQRPEKGNRFYFQGTLDPNKVETPWDFEVTYKVNGVETAPEKVGGASGTVEIDIDAIPNKHVSEYMKNNMVLMVAIPMDTSDVYSIDAPDSMEVNFGNYSGIGFEALPGKEAHFVARFGTDCFESMGVMMLMSPVTTGDISKIKDIKELEEKFRDNTNTMMDGVDALMDNIVDMSDQLDQTNQMLNELSAAKNKVDAVRPAVLDGVDVSLQDARDLGELLDSVDGTLKTTQWLVYDINTVMNKTDRDLSAASSAMSNLSKKLKTLGNDMGGTEIMTPEDIPFKSDMITTKDLLNGLSQDLKDGKAALKTYEAIMADANNKNDIGAVISSAMMDGEFLNKATNRTEKLPGSVVSVMKKNTDVSKATEESLKGSLPTVASLIAVNNALNGATSSVNHTASAEELASIAAVLAQGDETASGTAIASYVQKHRPDLASNPAELMATVQATAAAIKDPAKQQAAAASASGYVDHMVNLMKVKGSLEQVTAAGSKTVEDLADAYNSVDYDELVDSLDDMMEDLEEVMNAGGSAAYATSKLMDKLRVLTADADNLVAVMNAYYIDVQEGLTNVSNCVEQTEKSIADITATGQLVNDTLRGVSGNLSNAGDKGISVGKKAVNNANKMIENTKTVKEASADLRKSINDELDKEEDENNFLNMDPDAAKISFTSTKNQEPKSIAIICKTGEIKAGEKAAELVDAEFAEQQTSFGGRIANIFRSFWKMITGFFGK